MPFFQINTASLLFIKSRKDILGYIVIAGFIVVVTILTIKTIFKIRKRRKLILRDSWSLVDIVIIIFSITCTCLYVSRAYMIKYFLDDIERAMKNEFINYFHLFYAESALTILAAFLVFVATLRLWKLLRFLKIIKIVEKTLIIASKPLLGLVLCQAVITLYFTIVGTLFFGDYVHMFRSFGDTIITMILMCLNLYFMDLDEIRTTYHYTFYFLYYILNLLILNVYITLLTIAYNNAQLDFSTDQLYGVFDYLEETVRFYYELILVKTRLSRLRGGNRNTYEELPVSAKSDVHRYANCLTISSVRMRRMFFIMLCLLRNLKRRNKELDRNDCQLIKETIVALFRKETDDKELFYESNVEGFKLSLVDDAIFVKMEAIVKVLFQGIQHKEDITKMVINRHAQKLEDLQNKFNILLESVNKINVTNK